MPGRGVAGLLPAKVLLACKPGVSPEETGREEGQVELLRTLLFIPGNRGKMIDKARSLLGYEPQHRWQEELARG